MAAGWHHGVAVTLQCSCSVIFVAFRKGCMLSILWTVGRRGSGFLSLSEPWGGARMHDWHTPSHSQPRVSQPCPQRYRGATCKQPSSLAAPHASNPGHSRHHMQAIQVTSGTTRKQPRSPAAPQINNSSSLEGGGVQAG